MTHRVDVARSRDVVARWCALAEQRLEYLTELFETGRWRRFHSERAFLENIQEAKSAVELWRGLATPETILAHSAFISWPAAVRAELPRGDASSERVPRFSRPPVAIPASTLLLDASIARLADQIRLDGVTSAPLADAPALDGNSEPVWDLDTIEERYPLLRNAL
jgi:uncharacterized repeat protein (TIGR03809 family)